MTLIQIVFLSELVNYHFLQTIFKFISILELIQNNNSNNKFNHWFWSSRKCTMLKNLLNFKEIVDEFDASVTVKSCFHHSSLSENYEKRCMKIPIYLHPKTNLMICTILKLIFYSIFRLFVAGLEAQVQESSKDLYWF